MESRPRRPKQLRRQIFLPNYTHPKSRFSVEFDCATQNSDPNHPTNNLFFNGQLLSHNYPSPPATNTTGNNTNSWSARKISAIDETEKRRLNQAGKSKKAPVKRDKVQDVLLQQYGFQLIMAVPLLSHQVLLRRSKREGTELGLRGKKEGEEQGGGRAAWFGRRFYRWVVSACKECHAIKPATREDAALLPGNMKLQ